MISTKEKSNFMISINLKKNLLKMNINILSLLYYRLKRAIFLIKIKILFYS